MVWVFLFVICTLYEAYSWLTGRLMLTQLIVKYIPSWIVLPIIGWLFIHFAIRYFNQDYISWLKSK